MTLRHNELEKGRHKTDGIPEALRAARDALGLSRNAVAADLAIDPSTLQRWEMPIDSEHHRRISAADHRRLMEYYAAKNDERHKSIVPRDTIAAPPHIEKAIKAFEREAARMGATDPELDHIHWSLHNPESSRMFYLGESGKPLTAQEQEEELGYQIDGLRVWLNRRIAKRKLAERKTR